MSKNMQERFPVENNGRGVDFTRLDEWNVGTFRQRLYVMLGAVSLVLLIACGNVANLLLARGAARAKEMAIRTAIGAGRGRIVRQLLTESMVLSLLGAVVGLAVTWALVRVLVAQAPAAIPRIAETQIDVWVLLFALAASVVSAVVFGLVPSLRAGRQDLQPVLREGGRNNAGAKDAVRTGLIVAEVALSLTLLMGAGLLIRSAINLGRVDPGFDARGLLMARVGLPARPGAEGVDAAARSFRQMIENIRQQPGVAGATLVNQAPLGPGGNSNGLLPEGKAVEQANFIDSRMRMVMPGYFETMGISLLSGRDFTEHDVRASQLVMVVSEALAKQAWPNENPIGKRVACCEGAANDPMWKTVIGVARDVRSRGPAVEVRPEFYLPITQVPPAAWQWTRYAMTLVARARSGENAASLTPALRAAVKAVEPNVPLYAVAEVEEQLRQSTASQRFNTFLLAALGAVGLLLAAVGIYSVIAYFVSLRTQEIGIRMALGASTRDVLGLMTWQGVRPVLIGVVVGAVGAYWATRLLAGSLFGVSPYDPATFALVAALLIVVSLFATLVPARRATRVNPIQALGS
jgi:putative ABC transport system permease protein